MSGLEKNDVSLLSHMIYSIYNTKNLDEMRLEFLNLIKYVIAYNTANFYLVKKNKDKDYILTDPVNLNSLKVKNLDKVINEYMEKCANIDSTHWVCDAKKSMAYRTTDLISEEVLENTEYYKTMFSPYDVHYGAQVVLSHKETCVGLMTLFRSKKSENFSDKDLFILDAIKDHLSAAIYDKIYMSPSHKKVALDDMEKYDLTKREMELLNFLLEGYTNEEIIEKICISENTLRKHLYNLFHKLGIKHRWELYFL